MHGHRLPRFGEESTGKSTIKGSYQLPHVSSRRVHGGTARFKRVKDNYGMPMQSNQRSGPLNLVLG